MKIINVLVTFWLILLNNSTAMYGATSNEIPLAPWQCDLTDPKLAATALNLNRFRDFLTASVHNQQVRNEFKLRYTVNKVFEGMSDSAIEEEIVKQPNKAIAIKLYRGATLQPRQLKPLDVLLDIPNDQIVSIENAADTEDSAEEEAIKSFFCQRTFRNRSAQDIESEVTVLSKVNENLAFGLHSLACKCGKDLKAFDTLK